MKALTIILLSLTVGWSSAYLIKVPTIPTQPRIAPVGWVHIQKLLLPLFENVCEESTNAIIVRLAADFNLDTSNGDYTKTGVVEYLRNLKTSTGFLSKGEIFTEYNKSHINELKAIFELFYYAKDFDTFYRAAAWARQTINCGLFVDAIYMAIINRRDTEKVSIPAPYELMPNYFINRDAVVKASFLLNGDEMTTADDVRIEGNAYILDAKYTAEFNDSDEDAKLAYFREDIGLNAYYFIRKLRNLLLSWSNTPSDTNNFSGERIFQMMKQFAARYDLERYANELPELEEFTWSSLVNSYDPMLIYSNGNEFDHRSYTAVINDSEDVALLKTIENNLSSVVTHLAQAGHSKSQILNHLIELLVTSDKSYETMAQKLLGYVTNGNARKFSVLEHYMTTMRDPVFWRINKKIVKLINNALKVLPTYTRNELYFPGVEVNNVEIKKMMTSFDKFQFDVTDSLKIATANATFQVKVEQPRLNHKPFVIKLNISSLVTKKGFVKMYLGPKMMPGELALKKHLFVLLDMFELSLKRGANVISRSSEQMTSFSDEFISLRTLKKKVEDAEFGLDALPLKTVECQVGYPSRLILPKGLSEGLPLQMFVFVAPFTKGTIGGVSSMTNIELNTAILSPGFPLDLTIETRQLFGLPNAFVKDIIITQKSESKPNGGYGGRPNPNQPYDNAQSDFNVNKDFHSKFPVGNNVDDYSYDDSVLVHGLLGDRPELMYKKTTSNNYSSKKAQYRKINDFTARTTELKKKDNGYPSSDKQYEPSSKNNDFDDSKNDNMKNNEQSELKISIKDNDYKAHDSIDQDDKFQYKILQKHELLGERPAFTYKNNDAAKSSQYRKEDHSAGKSVYEKKYMQDGSDNTKINKQFKLDTKNVNDMQDLKDHVKSNYFYDTTVTNDFVYNNKLPKHGLLSKNIEDYTVKKNKYEIKKDDYIQKAETKKVDYRKKALDKKSKVGIIDYTLLEKPEDTSFINEDAVFGVQGNIYSDQIIGNKYIINDKDKKLHREIVGEKTVKDLKSKEVFKEAIDKSAKKDSDNMVKNVKVVKVPFTVKEDPDNIQSTKNLNSDDQYSKPVYKNKNGTSVSETEKNKYFSKIISDDSDQNDLYDKNRFTKTINKDVIKNRDVYPIPDPDTTKNVWDSKETEVYVKDGFTKTINKDINKNVNRNTVSYEENIPTTENDYSIDTYFNEYLPLATTERTKKRVSVYDFIFNPINYEDENLRVYE